jgi:hypothetical protein
MGFGELDLDIPLRGEVGRDRTCIVWRANMPMPSGTGPRVRGLRILSITATLEMRLTPINPPRTEESAASLRTFRTRLTLPDGLAPGGRQIRLAFDAGVNANLTLTAVDARTALNEAPVQLDSISLVRTGPGRGNAIIRLNRAPTGDVVYTVNLTSDNSVLTIDPTTIRFRAGMQETTVPWRLTAGSYGMFTVTADGHWGNETRSTTRRATLRVTNNQTPEEFAVLLNHRDLEFTRPPVGCFIPDARLAEGNRPSDLPNRVGPGENPKRVLPSVDPNRLQPGIENQGGPAGKPPAKTGPGTNGVDGKPIKPVTGKSGEPAGQKPGKAYSGNDGEGLRPIPHPPTTPADAKPATGTPDPKKPKLPLADPTAPKKG